MKTRVIYQWCEKKIPMEIAHRILSSYLKKHLQQKHASLNLYKETVKSCYPKQIKKYTKNEKR